LIFGHGCWHRSAEIERSLRESSVTVPRDDLFVAAAALEHGVALYTRDAHFELMRSAGVNLQLVP
jgi:predicted nucleic acid-binding protein